MKKIIILFFVSFVGFSSLYAFSPNDTIEIVRSSYYYRGSKLTGTDLNSLLANTSSDIDAQLHKAKVDAVFTSIFSYTGGFCVGYSLGYWLTSGHFNWQLMAVGVGSIGVAIPFAVGSNRRVRKAVELYNQGITTRGYTGQIVDFQLGITPGSVGLIMRF